MSIVAFGLGISGLGGAGGYYAVDGVTMEVDMPEIELVVDVEEVVLVLDEDGIILILDDDDIELEVD